MMIRFDHNLLAYYWRVFECEICKKAYPYIFKIGSRYYSLVEIDIPANRNFLWIEQMTFEKNSSRTIYIILPTRERSEFKLGRGHEADVRVNDISVSRTHAIIKFEDDHYIL